MSKTLRHSLMTSALIGALQPAHPTRPRAVASGDDLPPPKLGGEPVCLIKRLPANERGRDFVVGDLHGCYELLLRALDLVEFDRAVDRLFCTGNLADGGPDPLRCLSLLNEPWFVAVAGNHEEYLLRAVSNPLFDWQGWAAVGGMWAGSLERAQLEALADKVAELPLCVAVGTEADRFNVIHAEFHGPDEVLDDVLENADTSRGVPLSLTWGRDLIAGRTTEAEHEGLSLTFCGHTTVEQVSRLGSHVFVDTGALDAQRGAGNRSMSLVEVKTGRMWSVPGVTH